LDALGKKASWLELSPLSGRTHQLRVHTGVIETPIVGDAKYGGDKAGELGLPEDSKMHLHARALRMPHPIKGMIEIIAPLPPHMKKTFDFLGFDEKLSQNPFDYFKKE
ncbi:MAG: hypothetical protein LBU87_00065, partial [Lactobacillales bacterium]|jgi:23S rRNA pseudouridine955/2504/2580 synthase|nr:hypothetical protein [Lactobacillales bacterium]